MTPRASAVCALVAGPAVLLLELWRRAGALDQIWTWLDDAIGAVILICAALFVLRDSARSGLLALAWAFAAGQLAMSLFGQFQHVGPDPSGQSLWLVASIKAALLAGAAILALATLDHRKEGGP